MTTLNSFVIKNGQPGFANFAVITQALTDEVIDELTEKDDETIGYFMAQMGEVIAWIGHGDNSRLPEAFKPFAEQVQLPSPEVRDAV